MVLGFRVTPGWGCGPEVKSVRSIRPSSLTEPEAPDPAYVGATQSTYHVLPKYMYASPGPQRPTADTTRENRYYLRSYLSTG